MLKRLVICVASILVWSSAALAKDVPGGKDHPLIGRYDGAAITLYKTSDYAEQRILTKPITSADRRATGTRVNANNSVAVAGRSFRIRYDGPAGRSPLENTWLQRVHLKTGRESLNRASGTRYCVPQRGH